MSEFQYPFIDIAVSRDIRDRFAAGEAIVVFSLDLARVLWSNGAGARLFGNGLIYDFIDQGPDHQDVSFRQLESTASQLNEIGDRLGFAIRIGSGFERVAIRAEVARIAISPGNEVIMFATPVAAKALGIEKSARQMLDGFDDSDTHMAVLNDRGEILAASAEFARIGVSPELARSLVHAVGRSADNLIKRPIETGRGYLPAAIGKLSDNLHLLFCVETVLGRMDPPNDKEGRMDPPVEKYARMDPPEAAIEPFPLLKPPGATDAAMDGDGPFEEDRPDFAFNRSGRPVRFVWKINPDGHFVDVSAEFAQAVGPHVGNINGVSFRDLASLFNLDPEGRIIDLLNRRDTWSGRTIFWPVEGTNLIVPIDLAALPTYSRSREFDGFRGFGIVRVADAEEDPHAMGLAFGAHTKTSDAEEKENAAPGTNDDTIQLTIDPPATNGMAESHLPSGKVIALEERRPRSGDGLTLGEQAAFREIARQLETFGRSPEKAAIKDTDADGGDFRRLAPSDFRSNPDNDMGAGAAEEATDALSVSLSEHLLPRTEMTQGLSAGLIDQIPTALLIHVGDHLIHANPEFFHLSGYADLADLQTEGGIEALIARKGDPSKPGIFMVRKDGTGIAVSARLQSVLWQDQTALVMAIAPLSANEAPQADPVDDVREQYASLKIEADELRAILETATDGVVLVSTEGEIRSMNRSASALFNYDNSETRGRPFAMLFAHESQKSVMNYLFGLAGHGVASVLNDGREVIGREANGGFIPMFMTLGKLGSANGYCAVIRDITHWKRSEEELRSAKRAAETANAHKSDFLARVSHEIRTPLNAIIGFADMMAGERLGSIGHPRYVEYANDIGRSGRYVLDIVNDLLDISKIESGEMDLDFAAVGINECISEAVSIIQPQANSQRVIIRTSLSNSVPEIVADLRSIKQIALNILANAIRFTPSGGQVVVSTAYENNGTVVLRIRDTGIGMTRTELEQAMKPFRQVTTAMHKRGDGTGLGLPLTKAMVEANRANFTISSSPNEGTLVEITFPSQRVLAD